MPRFGGIRGRTAQGTRKADIAKQVEDMISGLASGASDDENGEPEECHEEEEGEEAEPVEDVVDP